MRLLLGLALLAYPLVVYLLIDTLSPLALAGVFALVTGARLTLAKQLSARAITLGLLAIAILCVATLLLQDTRAIKLYPVALSFCGAMWCAYTLLVPPSAIERLLNAAFASRAGLPAQMRDRIPFDNEGLAPSAVQRTYMRRLTIVWLIFFAANALASTASALIASTGAWALYNGLISYVLAGLLLVGEFFYRPFYQRKHESKAT